MAAVEDEIGQTLLHWAVRAPCLRCFWACLDKCPELAERPTKLIKNPAGWTPLMMLCQTQWQDETLLRKMTSGLVSHMSVDALAHRSGTFATVVHLAASFANWVVMKKVLYRVHELGGQRAVTALLAARSANAPWLQSV